MRLVTEHPWTVVLEVLRHEMAHQYVDEVLGVHDETAHGPTFQAVCEARAIDGRAAGVLEVDKARRPSCVASLGCWPLRTLTTSTRRPRQ